MTIAACYLSSEGVVFGADSTSTMIVKGMGPEPGSEHQYNFAQKIFEIGENGTLGLTMWGMGALGSLSYRTLIAQFGDEIALSEPRSVAEAADRWNRFFWSAYSAKFGQRLERVHELVGKSERTPDEDQELGLLYGLSGGFCIGGYVASDRSPSAFEIQYNPAMNEPAPCDPVDIGSTRFWGCPNLIKRLLYGVDWALISGILDSGKWSGTEDDLFSLIRPSCLGQPFDLPIREAVDWVHASIYTTIKVMKFSHMAPVCGGPVEVAAITSDRRFRWVRHKGFDVAIGDGSGANV